MLKLSRKLLEALPLVLVILLAGGCNQSQPGPQAKWLTNLPEAQTQAKTAGKRVFMLFTGSDWCSPCIALHKTVMTSKEFTDYAEKNLVLLELDYPNDKPQPEELKKANADLAKTFKIEGYPTVILLDSNGKQIGEPMTGYNGEKPAEYIAKLKDAK